MKKKMRFSAVLKKAWTAYTAHFGESMLFLLFQLVIRLITLCPLLFLLDKTLRWGALLTPALFVLLVLPARQNAAEAMQHALRGMPLFSARLAFGGEKYGVKVLRGLKTTLCCLVWALPVLGVSAWAARLIWGKGIQGQTDGFTLLFQIQDLGGGDLVTGVLRIALIYLAIALPVVIGLAFHSGRRHEWALGERRVVPGHRSGVMLVWLFGLLTCLPFAAAAGLLSLDYVRELIHSLSGVLTGGSLPPLDQRAWLIAASFAVLLVPLIPFKSLLTAAAVHDLWEGQD